MVKLLLIIFVTVAVFTGALYIGIFELIGLNIGIFTSDFLPFIPLELRLGFFMVILAIVVATAKSFTN